MHGRSLSPRIPINNETKELRERTTPPHLAGPSRHRAPDAIFTSDNEPPADIYIFNSINPQRARSARSWQRAFLSAPLSASSLLHPTMAGRHQQPHRGRHLLALIDRKGSPPRLLLPSLLFVAAAVSPSRESRFAFLSGTKFH